MPIIQIQASLAYNGFSNDQAAHMHDRMHGKKDVTNVKLMSVSCQPGVGTAPGLYSHKPVGMEHAIRSSLLPLSQALLPMSPGMPTSLDSSLRTESC